MAAPVEVQLAEIRNQQRRIESLLGEIIALLRNATAPSEEQTDQILMRALTLIEQRKVETGVSIHPTPTTTS